MVVDLRRLDLTVLHEDVVGDYGDDKRERDYKPDDEKHVDDNGEEASWNAAAESRSEPSVDLGSSGSRRQTAHDQEYNGERAHHRRHDYNYGLNDSYRVPFEFDFERRVEHLNGDGEGAIQAPAEYAHPA